MELRKKYRIRKIHESLKPCSVCGKDTAVIIGDGSGVEVVCSNPDCFDMQEGGWTEVFAMALWNKRPIEDALRAELARKDELIKRLEELVALYDTWTPLGHTVDWANKFEDARAAVDKLIKEEI